MIIGKGAGNNPHLTNNMTEHDENIIPNNGRTGIPACSGTDGNVCPTR